MSTYKLHWFYICTTVASRTLSELSFVHKFVASALPYAYSVESNPNFSGEVHAYKTVVRMLPTWMAPDLSLSHSACHSSGFWSVNPRLSDDLRYLLTRTVFRDLSLGLIIPFLCIGNSWCVCQFFPFLLARSFVSLCGVVSVGQVGYSISTTSMWALPAQTGEQYSAAE